MSTIEKSAGEAIEPKAPEVDADGNPIEPKAPDSDPLDAIEDEVIRNDMKRIRAIDQRAKKKAQQPAEEPVVEVTPSAYATKDDLDQRDALRATREAKVLVAPEVKDAWDELTKIPLGGYDPMDSESVAKNMQQRYNLHKMNNPDEDDPTKGLKTSPEATSKGKAPKKTTKKKEVNLPGYKKPAQPADWYPE